MKRTTFLGLGAMGSRMAQSLIDAGFEVTVWTRSPGRISPESPLHPHLQPDLVRAVEGAEAIISMVRDDEASREIWVEQVLPLLAPGTLAIESSTISVDHAREMAALAAERGVAWVEAPLSGSLPQAEAKALIFFAAGEASAVDAATPLLLAMGGAVHPVGEAGAGAVVKLAVNALLGVQVAAVAEILRWIGDQGLDQAQVWEVIGATPVLSPVAKINGSMMLNGQFSPLFPVELLDKDLRYTESGPVLEAIRARTSEAISAGLGGENMTALFKLP